MRIDDFANLEIAKECKLTKAEVIALRFYTTSGFKTINNALRDRDRLQRGETHPLPIMVWLLQNAVKKMRTQAANSDTCMQKLDLYRVMSEVEAFIWYVGAHFGRGLHGPEPGRQANQEAGS